MLNLIKGISRLIFYSILGIIAIPILTILCFGLFLCGIVFIFFTAGIVSWEDYQYDLWKTKLENKNE